MTIQEARKKFPEETKSLTDKELTAYCTASEILSNMFINSLKEAKKIGLDNDSKRN